jgi:hypothetical protein
MVVTPPNHQPHALRPRDEARTVAREPGATFDHQGVNEQARLDLRHAAFDKRIGDEAQRPHHIAASPLADANRERIVDQREGAVDLGPGQRRRLPDVSALLVARR